MTREEIVQAIRALPQSERLEVLCYFCPHCGADQTDYAEGRDWLGIPCQCWNDE